MKSEAWWTDSFRLVSGKLKNYLMLPYLAKTPTTSLSRTYSQQQQLHRTNDYCSMKCETVNRKERTEGIENSRKGTANKRKKNQDILHPSALFEGINKKNKELSMH
jgi:hypothetical protein